MYSEEQVLQKVSNRKQKKILIFTIAISVFCIMILFVCMYFYTDNQPLIEFPLYSLSTEEWTTDDVTITITNDRSKILSYSFDGGATWQANNTHTMTENGEVTIQVMDTKNKLSKKNIVVVSNIDRTPPEMVFESVTTIQMGSSFSVRNGVQVSDKESGLSRDYTAVPNTIDVTKEGEYQVVYSAFDRAGNFVEKSRTIIVKDIVGRTYYRYRDGKIETYQCNPYLCNCVSSSIATSTGTCPTGFTLNDKGECCNTCYKACSRTIWGEWSEWSQKEVKATATREVETMIKED
ncbi:MAG: DUF5011 domain-containing protein [Bacilli bacterium]|nr:DUF5011 domain-containing protein [Bacilli bacterium]